MPALGECMEDVGTTSGMRNIGRPELCEGPASPKGGVRTQGCGNSFSPIRRRRGALDHPNKSDDDERVGEIKAPPSPATLPWT